MNIKPLHDKILVQLVEPESVSKGGILLPEAYKKRPQEAIVLAVGGGAITNDGTVRPLEVGVGDRIMLGKYSGADVQIDSEDMLVIKESDILAVVCD
jgi:chaperonin GroES